jgi:hypothetical protein
MAWSGVTSLIDSNMIVGRSFEAAEVVPHPVAVAGLAQLQQGP